MSTLVVPISTREISDRESFHTVFRQALGFPEFYGRNMDAWIDCLTSIDDPASGMTSPSVSPGEFVMLRIDDAAEFRRRCPDEFSALIECAAFVNYRRVEMGEKPVLGLMLIGDF